MSILHPSDDDPPAGYTSDDLFRKALNRSWRLTFLFRKVSELLHANRIVTKGLTYDEIEAIQKTTWRDEPDDMSYRLDEPDIRPLPRLPGMKPLPCHAQSDVCDGAEQPLECEREKGHDGLHHCKFGRAVVTWSDT